MADQGGCQFLMGLVERFRKSSYPASKKVSLTKPSPAHLSIPNCRRKCLPARELELRYRREFGDIHWSVSELGGRIIVELGLDGLLQIDRGASDMMQGRGDWAGGEGNESLWFWWYPREAPASRTMDGQGVRSRA